MLHLDTNALIELPRYIDNPDSIIVKYYANNTPIACSSVAWFEFMCGPVHPAEISLAQGLLTGGIFDYSSSMAELAAKLFNSRGRKRQSQLDCLIAAHAITQKAQLLTRNHDDFQGFLPYGLVLCPPEDG